jgi:hypothetical protein
VSITVLFFSLTASIPAVNDGVTPRTRAGLFSNLVFFVATGVLVVRGRAVSPTNVRDLRVLSHKRSVRSIGFLMLESVEVSVRMLGKEIRDTGNGLVVEVETGVRIEGVEKQVSQIFINLMLNPSRRRTRRDRRLLGRIADFSRHDMRPAGAALTA